MREDHVLNQLACRYTTTEQNVRLLVVAYALYRKYGDDRLNEMAASGLFEKPGRLIFVSAKAMIYAMAIWKWGHDHEAETARLFRTMALPDGLEHLRPRRKRRKRYGKISTAHG